MSDIYELVTLIPKGQITLPWFIRQVLSVDTGSTLVFELRNGEVVVTNVSVEYEDQLIGAFLDLLSADIQVGYHVSDLPKELDEAMQHNTGHVIDLNENIVGDVMI
ncbi:AbrB family transcriptional regulator [Photorhabdus laumondii subsp. laumondii]|uniref:Photorhabdus luminescens subsp. laumondii TTO1 complete genome segment 13/17 n=2 Tax=Photorhabdus laumondii subsp. laumondii TaxID=141679 RepID=Q7N0Q6_PHOLL|nr:MULTISPECIES: type II toxin-antitoxin system PrlF family antitoxin [Photorhabdus]AXG48741.1 AbrB family transcriptional regulator [Photorhabdus laumondii subsp. laumondii]KTL63468.1 AbrB family transcriptional regulator [Photorhabdus laumondii subsp. laumondii]MCC8385115.1 type II toxin-antitoxin system PrlF family antitoxin [Photorhabdus laumondii]MCC8413710.1 type II toxin-antitoxin system PrlF family antitoxin [Photorhabdus laumondii]NDK94848.1 AbrB family transcriptional regulator [Phot